MSGKGTRNKNSSPSGNAASTSASEWAFVQHTSDSLSEHNVGPNARQLEHPAVDQRSPAAERGAIGDGTYQVETRRDPGPPGLEHRSTIADNRPAVRRQERSSRPTTRSEQVMPYPSECSIFRELARLNGEVNRMQRDQLRKELAELNLNTGGVKEVLQKRLKNYYRREKMAAASIVEVTEPVPYEFFVVVDFEATCRENNEQFVHEIIEFPAVLIELQRKKIVGMFREFCKPVFNPVLTDFCKHLTGVNQSEVDNASEFSGVLECFQQWLDSRELGTRHTFCMVTDGPWDIRRFLGKQCQISQVPMPQWTGQWINIRKTFRNFYDTGRLNLNGMLESLGLQFEGRPHCGLHDSINIARIVCRMLEDGSAMLVNERLDQAQPVVSTPRNLTGDCMAPPQKTTSAQGASAASASTDADSQSTPGSQAAVDQNAVL